MSGRYPDTPLEEQAWKLYERIQGHAPHWVAQAPGHVKLLGDHLSIPGGMVLSVAIDRHVAVALGQADHWSLASEVPGGLPLLQALGELLGTPPMAGAAVSTLPVGAGLSSSSALLAAAAAGLAPDLSGRQAALACQQAEQIATRGVAFATETYMSTLGSASSAFLIDSAAILHRSIPLPPDLGMVIIDSGVRRDGATALYQQRRAEIQAELSALGSSLRDLPADVPSRRLRHLVSELDRVRAFASALETGNLRALKEILWESHRSLRDDYEASVPAVDELVRRAYAVPGCLGARALSGKLEGTLLALMDPRRVEGLEEALWRPVMTCRPTDGAFTRLDHQASAPRSA